MEQAFDREKFKDAMHYVAARAGARPGFGATKLYKVLWFAEARTFVLYKRPLTNAEFIREKHGPVPRLAMPIRNELHREGRVEFWQDRFQSKPIWRMRALTPARTDRFNKEELDTLNYWIRHIDEDHTAASISEESHDYGWDIARMGERLPLHAFLAERIRDPNVEELEWAKRRAKELGLH